MDWGDALPAIGAAAGGIAGGLARQGSDNQALGISRDVYNKVLEMLRTGQLEYTPEIAALVQQGPSALSNIQADPGAVAAQRDALAKLSQASTEGYSDIDKAAINAALSEANANERSQREAVLARLQPGSGASIRARLDAQQQAANRANQQAMDVAANSRRQALAALSGYGNLAGNIRNQSFGEQAQIGQAQDAISRFNAANANNLGQFNAGAVNQARGSGVQAKVGALNALRGTGQDLAGGYYRQGQRTADMYSAAGEGLGAAGGQLFGSDDEDEKDKK